MSSYLQFGVICHWTALAMQVHLIAKQWRSRRDPPAFVAYSMGLLLTSAVLFVGFRACTNGGYLQLFIGSTALELALAFGVVGELWNRQRWGWALGMLFSSAAIANPMIGLPLEGKLIAALAFVSLFRPDNHRKSIAAGIVLYLVFPSILFRLGNPAWTTYIPVFSWMLAQAVWLGWLKTPEVTECHATK